MNNLTSKVQKPHVPTLVSALVVVVLLLGLYHLSMGRKRR